MRLIECLIEVEDCFCGRGDERVNHFCHVAGKGWPTQVICENCKQGGPVVYSQHMGNPIEVVVGWNEWMNRGTKIVQKMDAPTECPQNALTGTLLGLERF